MTEKLSRAERRRIERHANKFMDRSQFSKREVEEMNQVAYNMGVEHILEAAHKALGIGPIRRQRIVKELADLQHRDFVKPLKDKVDRLLEQ